MVPVAPKCAGSDDVCSGDESGVANPTHTPRTLTRRLHQIRSLILGLLQRCDVVSLATARRLQHTGVASGHTVVSERRRGGNSVIGRPSNDTAHAAKHTRTQRRSRPSSARTQDKTQVKLRGRPMRWENASTKAGRPGGREVARKKPKNDDTKGGKHTATPLGEARQPRLRPTNRVSGTNTRGITSATTGTARTCHARIPIPNTVGREGCHRPLTKTPRFQSGAAILCSGSATRAWAVL